MDFSIKQAAEKANVSQATIHNWIKSGKLSAHKQGKFWQISQASLDLCSSKPNLPGFTNESLVQFAGTVVAELKGLLEQALAMQQDSRTKTTDLESRITKLEDALKQGQAKQGNGQASQDSNENPASQAQQTGTAARHDEKPTGNSQAEPASQSQAEMTSKTGEGKKPDQPDEEKAEKWIRENLDKWLDERCPYKKAQGRSWRDLAANRGAKISLKGNDSMPRAYLHAIESWAQCESVWSRMKAKVALEVVNKTTSEFSYCRAVGG